MGGWDHSTDAVQACFQLLPLHLLIWPCLFLPFWPVMYPCEASLPWLLPPQLQLSWDSWPWLVPGKSPRASYEGHWVSVGHPEQRRNVLLSFLAARSWLCYWQRRCKMVVNPAQQLLHVMRECFLPLLQFNHNKRKSPPWPCRHCLERGDWMHWLLSPHPKTDKGVNSSRIC